MKICLLSTSFPIRPELVSGTFIGQLAEHLSKSVDLTVLTPSLRAPSNRGKCTEYKVALFPYAPPNWQILAHNEGGIPSTLKQYWYAYFLVPPLLISMFFSTLFHARKQNLIHANWAICGAVAGVVGRILRIPVITTIRGSDLERAKTSWFDRLILRLAVFTNQKLVTVNPTQRNALLALAPQAAPRLSTISNGVSKEFYAVGQTRTINQSPSRVLTVSRLVSDKEVHTILQALGTHKNRSLTLTIVGSGPEEARLKKLANELNLYRRVLFTGLVSHRDMPKLFADHDIFILASIAEGRPNAVLEAIATGTPVICSDIPGIAGLIENGITGRTFPVGNADILSERLSDAIKCPNQTAEMARKAREFLIDAGLYWERCAEEYIGVYRSLITKGHA